jgi:hypothetical protein
MLDVRVGDPSVHWLIFAGIAVPEWELNDDHIQRSDVLIDLGVDVTQVLDYTATAGLATIANVDSDFIFGTDKITLEQRGRRLFLRVALALVGESVLHRFGFQAHVKAVIDEPLIAGTIRWKKGIEEHSRDERLFSVTANLAEWQPGSLGPNLIPIQDAQVTVDAPVLNQDTYEVPYSIRNLPIETPIYVQVNIVSDAFTVVGNGQLFVSAVTPSDLPIANVAGPVKLGQPGLIVRGIDFVMTLQAPPR